MAGRPVETFTFSELVALIKERPSTEGVRLLDILYAMWTGPHTVDRSAIEADLLADYERKMMGASEPSEEPSASPVEPHPVDDPAFGRIDPPGPGHLAHESPDKSAMFVPRGKYKGLQGKEFIAYEVIPTKKSRSTRPTDSSGETRGLENGPEPNPHGKTTVGGRIATPKEIESYTEQLNREAAEQLQQILDGTYKGPDYDGPPSETSPTFPRSG